MLCAALSGSIMKMKLKYPLDASLPLALVALLGILLYLSSSLLQVRFRGDFGIVSDQAVRRPITSKGGERSQGFIDFLVVPASDIAQLFAPIGTGYESTMLNLKRDLKDV